MSNMLTTITTDDIWSVIRSSDLEALELARKIAGYQQIGWERARQSWLKKLALQGRANESDWEYKRAIKWEGWRFIGAECGHNCLRIPTGCVKMFIMAAGALGKEMKFYNERVQPRQLADVDWSLKPEREPRPYQDEAMKAVIEAGGRGIVQSPTASGKSYMMAMLISHYKTTALIKVPRLIILDQIVKELEENLNINEGDVGFIGRSKYEPSLITVTTTQSLANILKDKIRWNDFMNLHRDHGWGLLIEDEVHHGASKTSYDTSMAIDAHYRVGYSATALDREDNENIKIIGAYGEIVYNVPSEPLVENGWLIRPTIKFLPSKPVPMDSNAKWQAVYNTAIVYNHNRNLDIIEIAGNMLDEGRSTLIFVDRIDHGEQLENMAPSLSKLKDKVRFVHGTHPDRDDIIDQFRKRRLPIMISTEGIIGEGFDFRGLEAIIVADGGKSYIQTVQKVGRGMRIEVGKSDVKIFDFGDRGKYVGEHALRRKTSWEAHGFKVDITDTPYMG